MAVPKSAEEIAKLLITSILKEPLLHGDAAHKKWLTDELRKEEASLATLLREVWPGTFNTIRSSREDLVDRHVADLTAEEMTRWMIQYHGLPESEADIVSSNLKEQYKWHELRGRLYRGSIRAAIAKVIYWRRNAF